MCRLMRRSACPSFNDFVCEGEELGRDCKAERLRGLEVNRQIEFGRLFNGESCWILALKNAIYEHRRSTKHRVDAGAVAKETARYCKLSPRRYYGRPGLPSPLGDTRQQREKHGRSGDDDGLAFGLHDRS